MRVWTCLWRRAWSGHSTIQLEGILKGKFVQNVVELHQFALRYAYMGSFRPKGIPQTKEMNFQDWRDRTIQCDYIIQGHLVWITHVNKSIAVENLNCKRGVRISITLTTCRNTSSTLRLFFITFDSANSVMGQWALLIFEKESLLAGHTPRLKLRCPLPPTSRQLWFLDTCHRGSGQGLLTNNEHSVQASDMWLLFVGDSEDLVGHNTWGP